MTPVWREIAAAVQPARLAAAQKAVLKAILDKTGNRRIVWCATIYKNSQSDLLPVSSARERQESENDAGI